MSVVNLKVGADADDGTSDAGSWYIAGPYGTYVYCGDGWHNSARFQSVAIPKGATITAASFQAYGLNYEAFNVNARFYAWAHDSAPVCDGSNLPQNVTKTTAFVNWVISSWNIGSYNTAPDIKTVIQEIVNRAGWASGNSLNILLLNNASPSGNVVYFQDYSGSSANATKLDITYTAASLARPSIVKSQAVNRASTY